MSKADYFRRRFRSNAGMGSTGSLKHLRETVWNAGRPSESSVATLQFSKIHQQSMQSAE